jgi:hypothetical protein
MYNYGNKGKSILPNSFVGMQTLDQIRIIGDGDVDELPTLKIDNTTFFEISMAS